jgi:hypothetical protein
LEADLFANAARKGGVGGMTGRAGPSADGIDVKVHQGMVRLLAEIYRAQSAHTPSPFSTPLITTARATAGGATSTASCTAPSCPMSDTG